MKKPFPTGEMFSFGHIWATPRYYKTFKSTLSINPAFCLFGARNTQRRNDFEADLNDRSKCVSVRIENVKILSSAKVKAKSWNLQALYYSIVSGVCEPETSFRP